MYVERHVYQVPKQLVIKIVFYYLERNTQTNPKICLDIVIGNISTYTLSTNNEDLSFNLFVVSPVVEIIADPSSNVEENTNVSLHCTIETNTFPTSFVWKFRRNIIEEELSEELHIQNVNRYHFGVYICEVQNRIGIGVDSLPLIIRCK